MSTNLYKVKFIVWHDFISHFKFVCHVWHFKAQSNLLEQNMGEKWGANQRSSAREPKSRQSRVGSPIVGLLYHSTLKAKCEYWSIPLCVLQHPCF
jgi:hypothetical protein